VGTVQEKNKVYVHLCMKLEYKLLVCSM